jgi:Dyp-type peroxidase family
VAYYVGSHPNFRGDKKSKLEEDRLWREKKKQRGISFPSANKQQYILIIRINLMPSSRNNKILVQKGLRSLCNFFERIDTGNIKIDVNGENGETVSSELSKFNFSATIGFGFGFFEKLDIDLKNRPRKLFEMPFHMDLGDPVQYTFSQTDMILQLCSTTDFVNRWVLKTDVYPMMPSQERKYLQPLQMVSEEIHDVSTALKNWAIITDLHSGFQRLDGRNLLGFPDGISQPERLSNDIIWTTKNDEIDPLVDGTYMVFQKIEHDLEQWEKLGVSEQERWIGRSKATGLLLGTLSREEDEKLAQDCKSIDMRVKKAAQIRLRSLLEEQKDPTKPFYSSSDPKYKNIRKECPIWSHVRKANPRGAEGEHRRIIFRRGYLYMEDTVQPGRKLSSGLLFICFQRNIEQGFEYIKKYYLNNWNFPVPEVRKNYTQEELSSRQVQSRSNWKPVGGTGPYQWTPRSFDIASNTTKSREMLDINIMNTGKEGLAGPSQLGIYPRGDLVVTVPQGGGYYFIPPIPNHKISEIGQQFFR